MQGFIKLSRQAYSLLTDNPNAYLLLSQAAIRAWRGPGTSPDGLQPGQSRLGDCQAIGMTRKQYRTALNYLEKSMHLNVVEKGAKGTIVCIRNSNLFDINVTNETNLTHSSTSNVRNMGQLRGHQRANKWATSGATSGANKVKVCQTDQTPSKSVNYAAVNLQKKPAKGQLRGQLRGHPSGQKGAN